ncbi:related to Reticuline oxidase precursor [Sporisorium reilianum f. sp. reilianum]|uniref:Related to Reticuline oxidase n=1 Tax=Sporisorium reilianum f. sp. reilianum TaxID=72559 RepID=A0A2N8UD48_9BASI|nr:related to Reticuline oxidase precursor [Sporisorium reilianum f. sp. reilianum]
MHTPATALAWALLVLTTTLTAAFPIYTLDATSPFLARSAAADNTTSDTALKHCLHTSGGYERSYATTSSYSALSASYNPLFDYKPFVVAVPSTTAEISAIVKCVAAQNGTYKLSPRSGGHSYEAYSLGGHDGAVVVDLRLLSNMTVSRSAKTATVGAGVRLGALATHIWEQGGFALPHGTCPLVGVSGHALGGGFGFTTRAWGFLLDRITHMTMVDVDGVVRSVSADENADLWWALRGAGSSNFGIVTEFTFALEDAPTSIVNYAYSYASNAECARAVVALQNMTLSQKAAEGLEPAFGGELLVAGEAAGDFGGNACRLSGQHIGTTQSDHDALMRRFHTQAGISAAAAAVKPFTHWLDALQDIMGPLNVTANGDHEQFYAKSLVQPPTPTYDYDSALALIQKLNAYAGLHGTGNSISFDFLGPLSYPSAHVDASTSSFNAHGSGFVYQFYSYAFPGNEDAQAQQDVHAALDDLVRTAKASGDVEWGAYVNYVDARQEDWGRAYYADGLDRLKALKGTWDARDVFWFPQGLSSA